jgi:hemerythrin-like metal-binding protein
MSDFYLWDPQYLGVNVPEMDEEHRLLIGKMNAIYTANQEKKDSSTIAALLKDFAAYTLKHFQDEEALMERLNYSGLFTHQVVHQQLLKQVDDYVQSYERTKTLDDNFFNFLKTWLTSHIRVIDKKYAAKVHH